MVVLGPRIKITFDLDLDLDGARGPIAPHATWVLEWVYLR